MRETQITALLASLVASVQIYFSGKGVFSELPDAHAMSTDFVKNIAKEHGINPDFQVRLSDGYAAGIGTILVPTADNLRLLSTLDYALLNHEYANDKQELDAAYDELCEHIGSLDHEFTHYKNNDLRNSLIVCSLIDLAVYGAYFTYEYKILAEKLRNSSDFKKWLYTCASSLGLNATTALLNCWYNRFQERRADEGIRNEIPVLKAMIKCFDRGDKNLKAILSQAGGFAARFAQWLEKHPCLHLLLDPVHPPLPERIARFEERIAALEKADA